MTLNELRYLVAVAQERNFGRAAQKCFVSQPALSVAIQKLEDELGTQVFERGKSEVTVTPVGERIVEQAQRVLEESSRIREIAQAGRNQLFGTLKLGVIYTVAPYLLPDLIPALHERAPQMPLDIEENLTENLETGLEVGPHRRGDRRAAVRPARRGHRVPLRGAVPGGGAGVAQVGEAQARCSPSELAGENTILLNVGHCFRDQVLESCPELNRSDAHVTAHQLARDGAQHGCVRARHLGAAARRADAEVPQPDGGPGAVRASRCPRAALRSPAAAASRGPTPSGRSPRRWRSAGRKRRSGRARRKAR